MEDLRLDAGVNTLVVVTSRESSPWVVSVRLTDSDGNALQGLRTTLDPE